MHPALGFVGGVLAASGGNGRALAFALALVIWTRAGNVRLGIALIYAVAGALAWKAPPLPVEGAVGEGPALHEGQVEAPRWRARGCAFDLVLASGERVRVSGVFPEPPPPGARVSVFARARPSSFARNPGAPPRVPGAELYVSTPRAVFLLHSPSSPRAVFFAMRSIVRRSLGDVLDGDALALARALVIGDRSGIDPELADAVRRLGLAHVLAISGMHVGIVAGLVVIVVRTLRPFSRLWPVYAAIPVVLYVPIAGASGSVVRAAATAVVAILVISRGRRIDPLNLLAAAFLVTSSITPEMLARAGYVLSYAATGGILVYVRAVGGRPVLGRPLVAVHGVSVAATIATVPLVAAWFGPVPLGGILYSVPAGLLASGAVVPLFLSIVTIGTPIAPLFAHAAWPALHAFARGAALPLPAPRLDVAPDVAIALFLLCCLPLISRGPRSRVWPSRALLVATAAVLSLPPPRPLEPELHVLDVGAGDSIVLRIPDGPDLLIDTGRAGNARQVRSALRAIGVRDPVLVVTHPDEDHDGGADLLIGQGVVRALWIGGSDVAKAADRYPSLRERTSVDVRSLVRGDTLFAHARGTLTCLHPTPADSALADNERSVTLRFEWDGRAMLLTGDLEHEGLRRLMDRSRRSGAFDPLRADVLKVGHHGAAAATTAAFAARVEPMLAVVSCGRPPAPSTIGALSAVGAEVRRTDLEGAIEVHLGRERASVRTWREQRRRSAGLPLRSAL